MRRDSKALIVLVLLVTVVIAACDKKGKPPVARPMPPPADTAAGEAKPPAPPEPVMEPTLAVPPMPDEDAINSKSLDDLNRDSPLQPLFFALDSSEVTGEGMKTMQDNAAVLKKYPGMQITIEGHCDERGTAEYNLALGERRALAAKNYLVSLGIPADKIKTVSYGKEFPFDPGRTEEAFAKNRRAHFVVTSK